MKTKINLTSWEKVLSILIFKGKGIFMRNAGIFNRSNLMVTAIISLSMAYQSISAAATCPCDIYAAGGTPCVSAHSTVRALYGAYNGPLYQITRKSDNKTKDIGVRTPGGVVNAAVQDSFLAGTPGHITIIYDQSGNANHLTPAPSGAWRPADTAALASNAAIKLNGYTVHGVYVEGTFPSSRADTLSKAVGYRNNNTAGMPTGNEPEGLYMVVYGMHYTPYCCFDYGNAGKTNNAEGVATMEAVYFGNWGSMGHGAGAGSVNPGGSGKRTLWRVNQSGYHHKNHKCQFRYRNAQGRFDKPVCTQSFRCAIRCP